MPLCYGGNNGLSANGLGDFAGLFRGAKFLDEKQAEIDGGAGSAGSEQATVGDGAFGGKDRRKFAGDGEVRGVAATGEQTGVLEDGGCGADGGKPAVGGVVGKDGGAHAGIGAEEFHAGAAGEEEQIEEFFADGGERGVGVEGDGVAPGDVDGFAEGGDGDLDAGAAEQVDGGDGFEFFDAFGQDDQSGGHGAG